MAYTNDSGGFSGGDIASAPKDAGVWAGAGQESRKLLTSDLERMRAGALRESQAELEQRKTQDSASIARAAEAYDPTARAALADPYSADAFAEAGMESSERAAQAAAGSAIETDRTATAKEMAAEQQVRADLHRQQDISRENMQFAYDVRQFEHDAGKDFMSVFTDIWSLGIF